VAGTEGCIHPSLWKILSFGDPPEEQRTANQKAAEDEAERRNFELGNTGPTEAFYAAKRVGPDEWQVAFHDGKPEAGLRGLYTSFLRAMRDGPPH
jgi:hypothetical protein